jgi:hypothetical protein
MNLTLLAGLLTGSDNLHFGTAFGLLPSPGKGAWRSRSRSAWPRLG